MLKFEPPGQFLADQALEIETYGSGLVGVLLGQI